MQDAAVFLGRSNGISEEWEWKGGRIIEVGRMKLGNRSDLRGEMK